MKLKLEIFLGLVICGYPVLSLKSSDFECLKASSCSCVYPNNWILDLSPLSKNSSFIAATNSSLAYFYNPCQDFTLEKNSSAIGLLWIFVPDNKTNEALNPDQVINGTRNGTFTVVSTSESVQFQNTFIRDNRASIELTQANEKTVIQLKCIEKGNSALQIGDHVDGYVHSLQLTSPSACPRAELIDEVGGASTGTILVLIFFLFAFVYFFGGALWLRMTRGAEGVEMIPNHEFWAELPSLVKDGFLFAISCGRTKPDTYESI